MYINVLYSYVASMFTIILTVADLDEIDNRLLYICSWIFLYYIMTKSSVLNSALYFSAFADIKVDASLVQQWFPVRIHTKFSDLIFCLRNNKKSYLLHVYVVNC